MFNNGEAAMDFLAGTANFDGPQAPANRALSDYSKCRMIEEKAIRQSAAERGLTLRMALQKIMENSTPELANFVLAHKETPQTGTTALALQAVLLRAADIAMIAKAQDIPDAEALLIIERADQAATDMSSADAQGILPPDVAAAIVLILEELSKIAAKKGSSGSMVDIVNRTGNADSFDLSRETLLSVPGDPANPIGSPSPGGSAEGNASNPDRPNVNYPTPNYAEGAYGSSLDDYLASVGTTGASTTTSTPAASGGGFWDFLDKLTGAVTKIGGAVQSTAGAVGNASNTVKDAASDVGAASINKSLKENLPYIIGAIVLIIVIIVLIVYATKRK